MFDRYGVGRVDNVQEMAAAMMLMGHDRRPGPGGIAAMLDSGGFREMLIDLAALEGVAVADIADETRRCMENLKAILETAGMGFDQVVKSSIFLSDMHRFAEVNAVYGEYFDASTAPARETVEVANLPKFVNVEISMIAIA